MYAFLSYQSADKFVAGRLKTIVAELNIESFLAHEDITVSEEWRLAILAEVGKADIFIAILSARYYESFWCIQESGIAAFRTEMLIVPLSIDGTVPPGLLGHIQSTKIDPEKLSETDLYPTLAKRDVTFLIDRLIDNIAKSPSYRGAEYNFALSLPYLSKATDHQITTLLEKSDLNGQVSNASLCATKYLPPLMASHGHLLQADTRKNLEETLARYSPKP